MRVSGRALAPVSLAALLLCSAPHARARQDVSKTPQPRPVERSEPARPQEPEPETVDEAPAEAAEPLYREYRGVKIGMSADEVRAKLGKPEEKGDDMDFYVLSDKERARVYYQDGKTVAVIATYIGAGGAPTPAAVLGSEIEAKPDGSLYQMTPYPKAGYWVAYSRTAGDEPLVIITMQKSP